MIQLKIQQDRLRRGYEPSEDIKTVTGRKKRSEKKDRGKKKKIYIYIYIQDEQTRWKFTVMLLTDPLSLCCLVGRCRLVGQLHSHREI
jgi:hypothetical protein